VLGFFFVPFSALLYSIRPGFFRRQLPACDPQPHLQQCGVGTTAAGGGVVFTFYGAILERCPVSRGHLDLDGPAVFGTIRGGPGYFGNLVWFILARSPERWRRRVIAIALSAMPVMIRSGYNKHALTRPFVLAASCIDHPLVACSSLVLIVLADQWQIVFRHVSRAGALALSIALFTALTFKCSHHQTGMGCRARGTPHRYRAWALWKSPVGHRAVGGSYLCRARHA